MKNSNNIQWRIYIVKFWTRPPPGVQILSISCSFWENLAKSYVGAPPGELAPPPRGNPGSATDIFICIYQQTTTSTVSFALTDSRARQMVVKGGRTDFMFLGLPNPNFA